MQNVLMTAMIMLPVLTLSSFTHAQTHSSETTEQKGTPSNLPGRSQSFQLRVSSCRGTEG